MIDRKLTPGDLPKLKSEINEKRSLANSGYAARVTVHMGTCGIASGASDVLDALSDETKKSNRKDIKILTSGCIGLCSHEPLVTVETLKAEPIIYYRVDGPAAREIFKKHIVDGNVQKDKALASGMASDTQEAASKKNGIPHVSELPFFGYQQNIVLKNKGLTDPDSLEDYIWRNGYQGAAKALTAMKPEEIIQEVKTSGLRGRGGGGFPTGLKWEFASASKNDVKYVLCNADEGDPGAFMDRSVMEGDPHAVLEGMLIAAKAIGAHYGYIYCRAEYPLALEKLENAIQQAKAAGLLGDNILGTGFNFDLGIYMGAGAFVCGEETALIASIQGERGTPRPRPPFPAVSGLWKKPTVLNNVETYANVANIILNGGATYAAIGTAGSKGTKVFALTGKVNHTGLVEVPMGTTLGRIVFDIGGGIPKGKPFKAAQLGGPSGGCLPSKYLNIKTDYEAIIEAGAIMGSGGLIVMDDDTCMVDMARYFMDFCQDESCGKCTPCRVGTKRMLDILQRICEGKGEEGDIELLEDLAQTIKDSALCGLGQTAPNPVLSTLRHFRHEYEAHIHDKKCPAAACTKMFKSPCQHTCPIGMDVPAYLALIKAGRFDEAYEVIADTNPFPSVCGRVCSHPCQLKCRRGQMDESVAIRDLKRFASDRVDRTKPVKLPTTRSQKIAVIGAGPSGLTAALELRRRGYTVMVFEALPEAGGMLRYGIPSYRLPRNILDVEINAILGTGIELKTNCRVGKDITAEKLVAEFDAVYVAVGQHDSAKLRIEGEDAEGVMGAVEFLQKTNRGDIKKVGLNAVVIGGGSSSMDAARTALRLGAKKVTLAYRRTRDEMPAMLEELIGADEEGIEVVELVSPVRIIKENGKAKSIVFAKNALSDYDDSGRKWPVPIEGSEWEVPAETIVYAIGNKIDFGFNASNLCTVNKNDIIVDKKLRTSNEKVWAGGDAVPGIAIVIEAIAHGQKAAGAIDTAIRLKAGEAPYVAPKKKPIELPGTADDIRIDQPYVPMPELAADKRRGDFNEVQTGYTVEMAVREASRCLRCDLNSENK
jgi:NADH-quinone oxidoreductase subunit F